MIAVPSSLYVNQRLGDTRAICQRPEAFPFGLSLPVLSLSKGRRLNGQDVRPVETPVSRCTGQALRISDGHEELGLNGDDFPLTPALSLEKGSILACRPWLWKSLRSDGVARVLAKFQFSAQTEILVKVLTELC